MASVASEMFLDFNLTKTYGELSEILFSDFNKSKRHAASRPKNSIFIKNICKIP
jgi:hypothetical protein